MPPEPENLVRLQIVRQKEDTKYLTLHETTSKEVTDMISEIVSEAFKTGVADPFVKGSRTSVHVREAVGGKNGKSKSVSFHGLNVQETYALILGYIANKNK